jgi:hypothetical protein
MAYTLWSQDIFSKGELSPFMYARATVNEYGNGLKTAQNVITYPTGAAGKRFGTLYQNTLTSNIVSFDRLYFNTFQYLNECIYQMVFTPGQLDIYLEGILVATITGMGTTPDQIHNLSTTVLGPVFRCAAPNIRPFEITRSANAAQAITSFNSTSLFTGGAPFVANKVYPVRFTVVGGTILQTSPQITIGVTYFLATVSTTSAVIFSNAPDAKAWLNNQSDFSNAFAITGAGTGTTSVNVLNTWTSANTFFRNVPVFDFNGTTTSYDAITFTPSATTGSVTITLSAPYAPLTSVYIGGAFFGGGGTGRITAVADTSHFTVAVQRPFDSTSAIQGSLALLAEPAWSTTRGWPQVCSSYQNRALYANTTSLPNGFYASTINDYSDFGDLTGDDDDAISWYPTSDNMNFIRFIVPYRSITVHTNTGIYSSPLSDIAAITPSNFTLQLQDSTPADVLLPQAIDNQILVLSGNDAHQMLWDGINNAYTSDIVSVISEQLIREPIDEVSFNDIHHAGSRYVFIINTDGSMALFQTLISQNVSGFTLQIMEQSYGNASFIQAASSADGRAWFVVKREIAQAGSPVAITGFTSSSLHAVATSFSTTVPTAIKFTTTGSLPVSSPQITTTNYSWAIGVDADNFEVYETQEDALAGENAITFSSAGTLSNVVPWPLTPIFTLEELTQDVFLDCAVQYTGAAASTITTGALFNAQDVKMVGDGFGFDSAAEDNVSNQITFIAHGITTQVSEAFIGYPINTIMEPMPLSMATGTSAKTTGLTKPTRVMFARFMFNNTIGGTINGVPIAIEPFDQSHIGEPPFPARGVFEMSIMKGWDDFNNPTYTIEHNEPFNIQLLGVFYSVVM